MCRHFEGFMTNLCLYAPLFFSYFIVTIPSFHPTIAIHIYNFDKEKMLRIKRDVAEDAKKTQSWDMKDIFIVYY